MPYLTNPDLEAVELDSFGDGLVGGVFLSLATACVISLLGTEPEPTSKDFSPPHTHAPANLDPLFEGQYVVRYHSRTKYVKFGDTLIPEFPGEEIENRLRKISDDQLDGVISASVYAQSKVASLDLYRLLDQCLDIPYEVTYHTGDHVEETLVEVKLNH